MVKLMKTHQGAKITRAWKDLHQIFINHGIAPITYLMDNEALHDLKSAVLNYKLTYQLMPPNIHRTNATERAIPICKNHFLSGLGTVDPTFPIAEWDQLLTQATMTLNLLQNSRINPRLSAYTYVHGQYDFNSNPMAPTGTKVVIHDEL